MEIKFTLWLTRSYTLDRFITYRFLGKSIFRKSLPYYFPQLVRLVPWLFVQQRSSVVPNFAAENNTDHYILTFLFESMNL